MDILFIDNNIIYFLFQFYFIYVLCNQISYLKQDIIYFVSLKRFESFLNLKRVFSLFYIKFNN